MESSQKFKEEIVFIPKKSRSQRHPPSTTSTSTPLWKKFGRGLSGVRKTTARILKWLADCVMEEEMDRTGRVWCAMQEHEEEYKQLMINRKTLNQESANIESHLFSGDIDKSGITFDQVNTCLERQIAWRRKFDMWIKKHDLLERKVRNLPYGPEPIALVLSEQLRMLWTIPWFHQESEKVYWNQSISNLQQILDRIRYQHR